MIGIVLVTHGRLADELRSALEHVVGAQSQIEAIAIGPDDDIAQRREQIIKSVHQVDTGEGVVVLTDMFGGTPSNLAISVMERGRIEVLAGVNLPMLVKLASIRRRRQPRHRRPAGAGCRRKYINVASRILSK